MCDFQCNGNSYVSVCSPLQNSPPSTESPAASPSSFTLTTSITESGPHSEQRHRLSPINELPPPPSFYSVIDETDAGKSAHKTGLRGENWGGGGGGGGGAIAIVQYSHIHVEWCVVVQYGGSHVEQYALAMMQYSCSQSTMIPCLRA